MIHTTVSDFGPLDCKLILVGEAPGSHEVQRGEPFVGPSGHLLQEWWQPCGLVRADFYITNVYPKQPFKNDITKVPAAELDYWIGELHRRLAQLSDPWIIIPTGNTALRALTGDPAASIHKMRGSILNYTDQNNRTIKMIPTLHPAGVMRMKKFERRCRRDWFRIAQEAKSREITYVDRQYHIRPSLEDLQVWEKRLLENTSILSIDIETHPEQGITCVGFAPNPYEAYVIPVGVRRRVVVEKKRTKEVIAEEKRELAERLRRMAEDFSTESDYALSLKAVSRNAVDKALTKFCEEGKVTPTLKKRLIEWECSEGIPQRDPKVHYITVGYWEDEDTNLKVLDCIQRICESPIPKVLQNGLYDQYWLNIYNIEIDAYDWDTLEMHHCVEPNEEHSLHYLASAFINEPYWKDESKETADSGRFTSRQDVLWNYNGKDCTTTAEIRDTLEVYLNRNRMVDFYDQHYRKLRPVLFDMMRTGLRVDTEGMKKSYEDFRTEHDNLLAQVNEDAGRSLAGKATISNAKLKTYLYDELRLPRVLRRRSDGSKSESTDEVALRGMILKYPHKIEKVGRAVLRIKELQKLMEQCNPALVDKDGRFRSTYKVTTTTGRLASARNPTGSGGNAQNQNRKLRGNFIADAGRFILCMDLAQVESRIVYMLTRDPQLVREAQAPPWELDMHTENAKAIFGVDNPTEEQRYFGKRVVHAAQRGMRGRKMSDQLLKEEDDDGNMVVRTPRECDVMIDAYFRARRPVQDVYFAETRMKVMRDRHLINSWGRRIEFTWDRLDDDLYREAYSWLPQSDAAEIINQWGLIPLWSHIRKNNLKTRINAQVHDELVLNTCWTEAYSIASFLQRQLSTPLTYFGNQLSVPVSLKVGRTWKGDHEWKRFPSEKEFNEVVREICKTQS